jgi:hypothetical protein
MKPKTMRSFAPRTFSEYPATPAAVAVATLRERNSRRFIVLITHPPPRVDATRPKTPTVFLPGKNTRTILAARPH